MLYKIKINLKSKEIVNKKFYYSILGGVLNIFKNDTEIYENILLLSPLIKNYKEKNTYYIIISISSKKTFDKIINEILTNKKQISLDGIKFEIDSVDYDLKLLDFDKIIYEDYSKIEIKFTSPTIINTTRNNKNINYLLPEPKIYLTSILRKYFKAFDITDINLEEIKIELDKSIFVSKFDIKTTQVQIKNGLKAGVVGTITYNIQDNIKDDLKKALFFALRYGEFAGLGNGSKLGLGNIFVYFNK